MKRFHCRIDQRVCRIRNTGIRLRSSSYGCPETNRVCRATGRGQPRALRNTVIRAVLQRRESDLVACCKAGWLSQSVIGRECRNVIEEIILLVDQGVNLTRCEVSRPVDENGIIAVEGLLAICRRPRRVESRSRCQHPGSVQKRTE